MARSVGPGSISTRNVPLWIFIVITVFSGFPVDSAAGCWEVAEKNGRVTAASDIWHLRNKLTERSAFLGSLDGKETSVLVDRIRLLAMDDTQGKRSVFFAGRRAKGRMTFLDGRTAVFESDLSLTAVSGSRKIDIPFENIKSITRCDRAAIAAKTSETEDAAPSHKKGVAEGVRRGLHTIMLNNGNILKGVIITEIFHWRAPYAVLKVERRHVRLIRLGGNGRGGMMETWTGDRISGELQNEKITIRLAIGQTIELSRDRIKRMNFGVSSEAG